MRVGRVGSRGWFRRRPRPRYLPNRVRGDTSIGKRRVVSLRRLVGIVGIEILGNKERVW